MTLNSCSQNAYNVVWKCTFFFVNCTLDIDYYRRIGNTRQTNCTCLMFVCVLYVHHLRCIFFHPTQTLYFCRTLMFHFFFSIARDFKTTNWIYKITVNERHLNDVRCTYVDGFYVLKCWICYKCHFLMPALCINISFEFFFVIWSLSLQHQFST